MASKEDFDNLHNKVRRYVVKIRGKGTINGRGWSSVTPGTVFLKEDSFCHIVAHEYTFSHHRGLVTEQDLQPRYEVVFPDTNRTTVEFQMADVKFYNSVAAFFIFNVHLENEMVQAVPFSLFEAEDDEKVYTLCLHCSETDIPKPSFLSPGLINVAGGRYFTHDCRQDGFTSWGSPVFDPEGLLVGMCLSHRSVLLACNVAGIASLLSSMHGSSEKPIRAMLDYIRSEGEAMQGLIN